MTNRAAPSRLDPLEEIGRVIAVVSITVYGIGLLVVNAYLFELGISDFDLLKPRYILTGAVFILTVSISTIVPLAAGAGIAAALADRAMPVPAKTVRSVVLLLLLVAPVVFFRISPTFPSPSLQSAWVYFINFLFGLLLIEAMVKPRLLSEKVRQRFLLRNNSANREPKRGLIYYAILGVGIVYLGLQCVNEFTNRVFLFLPEQLGGGKPRVVRLVLDAPDQEALRELGLPLTNENHSVTEPVELLFEGSDFYVLQERDPPESFERRIFKVDEDLVLAVRSKRDQSRD